MINIDQRLNEIPNVGPMRWEPGDEPTPVEAIKQLIRDVLEEVKPEPYPEQDDDMMVS